MNIINKKTAQQIVDTVKDVCGHNINFINENGMIIASTDLTRIGTFHEGGKQVIKTGIPLEVYEDNSLSGTQKGVNIPVAHNGILTAVIGISGEPDEVRSYAYLAEKITRLLIREQELNDASRTQTEKKTYLIQTLLNGNIENPEYIQKMLQEFHLNAKKPKRVLLLQVCSHEGRSGISTVESAIHHLFERIPDSVFCFQYPNEFAAIIDSTSLIRIRPFSSLLFLPEMMCFLELDEQTVSISLMILFVPPGLLWKVSPVQRHILPFLTN